MTVFVTLLCRDIRHAVRNGGEMMTALFFFAVVVTIFPFALEGKSETLRMAAGGIIWVAALLAALLALESFYHRDSDDGTFDLFLLSGVPMLAVVAAKMLAHWLCAGLPLVLAAGLAAIMLFLPTEHLPVLLASLALGTFYLSLLGGFGAALTLGSRRPGLLLAVLALPLFIPMLILGVSALSASLAGLSPRPYLLLQLALVVLAAPLAPLASAGFLKMSLKS